ncbi:ATP binding protein [Sesbania bispinosa]|nr:ATP binding protein [Sesbania bispinosa]
MLAKDNEHNDNKELEAKLEKMNKDLEEVRLLNDQYEEKWALHLSQKQQIEIVHQEVEMETTSTILHLQEEVAGLQSELEGRLCSMAQENAELRKVVAAKEEEIRSMCLDWEKGILELTTFLLEGSRSLKDAVVKNADRAFQVGVLGLSSAYRDLIQGMVKETKDMRKIRIKDAS